ncbi:unnamed protein product, partial [marine sediment metagenome]
GNLTTSGTANISGNTIISGTLNVAGDTTVDGTLTAQDASSTVKGLIKVSDTNHFLITGGDLTFSDNYETMHHAFNGVIFETIDVDVVKNGANVDLELQQEGGGDLTLFFSDEYTTFDCTPVAKVQLTEGTDDVPELNYVYILQSNKTLTASTTGWPSTEFTPIATVFCPSDTLVDSDGAYKVHVWTDHLIDSANTGHFSHAYRWIRQQHATYDDGVAVTISGSGTGDVTVSTASGNVYQFHDHTFPAFANPATMYVVNDSGTAYTPVADLQSIVAASDGGNLENKTYALVLWGAVSEKTGDCKLFINLPSGEEGGGKYNKVREDKNKVIDYSIPVEFKGTGFLIRRLVIYNNNDTTWTVDSGTGDDLRGTMPNVSAGTTSVVGSSFADNVFEVYDEGDITKVLNFQASGISTGTTRTLTIPNVSDTIAVVGTDN